MDLSLKIALNFLRRDIQKISRTVNAYKNQVLGKTENETLKHLHGILC